MQSDAQNKSVKSSEHRTQQEKLYGVVKMLMTQQSHLKSSNSRAQANFQLYASCYFSSQGHVGKEEIISKKLINNDNFWK